MATTYCGTHFSLKHRLVAATSQLLQDFTYTQRHGLIRGMRRRGGLGFLPGFLTRGVDRTAEAAFLSSLDLRDAVVYDVGGFEGVLTLYFSRQARHVVTYEPNPPTLVRLLENLRLNDVRNVTVRQAAVGDRPGSLRLVCDPLMPGGATADGEVGRQIDATSTHTRAATVDVVRLDEDIARHRLPPPDFVKVDIEGMELPALRGMEQTLSRHAPALYLEMHGATMEDKEERVRRIVEFLEARGYLDILHVESGRRIDACGSALAREGHLFCTHARGRGQRRST